MLATLPVTSAVWNPGEDDALVRLNRIEAKIGTGLQWVISRHNEAHRSTSEVGGTADLKTLAQICLLIANNGCVEAL